MQFSFEIADAFRVYFYTETLIRAMHYKHIKRNNDGNKEEMKQRNMRSEEKGKQKDQGIVDLL